MPLVLLFIVAHLIAPPVLRSTSALDFLFNSFTTTTTATPSLSLTDDAHLEPPVIRLTDDSHHFSVGRAFYPTPISFKPSNTSTNITTTFSTQFVFSILPKLYSDPGYGLAFVLSASTHPQFELSGQYLGIFSPAVNSSLAPVLAVEFDTGRNLDVDDPDGNHIGIDLNNIISAETQPAGYYKDANGSNENQTFVPVDMRSGRNLQAWIDFNGPKNEINVTLVPAGMPRPERPLLTFVNPAIANSVSSEMYVGFSASSNIWVETQRLLAWSFSDAGVAKDIDTTNLPDFRLQSGSSSLSRGAISAIAIGCVVAIVGFLLFCYYWFCWRRKKEGNEFEDWELEYWPHRFSYEELSKASDGFSKEMLLGAGGFGKVYKGVLFNNTEVAVKCVNHDSRQGIKEFMAEISSVGRLQHKNLVQMRGWCRKGNELLLVYDYMPNGSLDRWIFDEPEKHLHLHLNWKGRRRVLADVAEGLNHLHHDWDKVVVHRDIKSSNVLLDHDMRGRVGDFGLAKLYSHGEVPNSTRVVGTFGYLAPELALWHKQTPATDVYSFGVVMLEVACGRRSIKTAVLDEEEEVLIDWVRKKFVEGKLLEVIDKRIEGEYELEEMEALLKLGLGCCHPDADRRPNMREVVAMLVGNGGDRGYDEIGKTLSSLQ